MFRGGVAMQVRIVPVAQHPVYASWCCAPAAIGLRPLPSSSFWVPSAPERAHLGRDGEGILAAL